MLVLGRRPSQSIIITSPSGDSITIKFLRINGNEVKVGVDAPREYGIVRDELVGRDEDFVQGRVHENDVAGFVMESYGNSEDEINVGIGRMYNPKEKQ